MHAVSMFIFHIFPKCDFDHCSHSSQVSFDFEAAAVSGESKPSLDANEGLDAKELWDELDWEPLDCCAT